MAELIVYAIGDSIMWGEGLNTENKFAMRAATSLAQARGLTPKLTLRAHCGAKIKATLADRIRFADLFPHLFKKEEERNRFTVADNAAPDERPTDLPWRDLDGTERGLHGEIPRAFPTVDYQLRSIPEDEAARVDVMLITGGANDLDFQALLEASNFLEKLDPDCHRIFYKDIQELLNEARRRCPKALIILTGYFSAFSPESQFDDMKRMFLALEGMTDAYEYLSTLRLEKIITMKLN